MSNYFPFTIKEVDRNFGYTIEEYTISTIRDLEYFTIVAEHFLAETFYHILDSEGNGWSLKKVKSYIKNKGLIGI